MSLQAVGSLRSCNYSPELSEYLDTKVLGAWQKDATRECVVHAVRDAIIKGKRGDPEGTPYYQSLLQKPSGYLKPNTEFLLLDFGGTNIKASLCTTDSQGNPEFTLLFEKPNTTLGENDDVNAVLSQVVSEALASARARGALLEKPLVGVVWSNALEPKSAREEDSARCPGVSGLVTGKIDGKSYLKPDDLLARAVQDGDDIGSLIAQAFKQQGVASLAALVVTNDTVAIGHGPICAVASTGTNFAIFDPVTQQYHNTELGNRAGFVPPEVLTQADYVDGDIITLEMLTAGAYAGELFSRHIAQVAEQYPQNPLVTYLDMYKSSGLTEKFSPKAMSRLLEGNFEEFCSLHPVPGLRNSPEILNELQGLLQGLRDRAATILACASAGVVEVYKQTSSDPVVIGLDSSQARLVPGYKAKYEDVLFELLNSRIGVDLLEPKNKVSVPTQGLIYFLSDLVQNAE